MLAKMSYYKVIVMSLKPRRAFPAPADDEVFVQERDTFFGHGYSLHRVGKYFDLWFSPKEDDPENFVTFGRITSIEEAYHGNGKIYGTKFGRFYVEEIQKAEGDNPRSGKGQGARGRTGGHSLGTATIPRVGGGRRLQTNWVSAGGGRDLLTPRKGYVAHQHRSEAMPEAQHLRGARTGRVELEGLATRRDVQEEPRDTLGMHRRCGVTGPVKGSTGMGESGGGL